MKEKDYLYSLKGIQKGYLAKYKTQWAFKENPAKSPRLSSLH